MQLKKKTNRENILWIYKILVWNKTFDVSLTRLCFHFGRIFSYFLKKKKGLLFDFLLIYPLASELCEIKNLTPKQVYFN